MFDMESNNFDKQIREKLQNMEPDFRSGNWKLMEQKLNAAEVDANPEYDDILLDGMAYGSLENYKADFNPTHWDLMEQKLDDAYYPLRRKLYRYKVVEVSLMLLALFTVIQFLPFKKHKNSKDLAGTQTQIERLNNLDFSNIRTALNNKELNQKIENETSSAIDDKTLTTALGFSNIDGNILSYSQNAPSSRFGTGLILKNKYDNNDINKIGFVINPLYLSLANRYPQSSASTNESVSILLPIDSYQPDKLRAASSAGLPECDGCKTINSTFLISIGMMGGIDADYITTPYDDRYHQNEFSQVAMGYGGGFTLGFKYHKWELETGAIYSAKYYGARKISEVNGSFEEGGYVQQGLLGVQLDILKVPLHLRYNFMAESKWNVYAHSGAAINMTIETLFEYTSKSVGNSDNPLGRYGGDPHSAQDGVFEGGSLIDNTYITANLGLGIERHFNSRMSVFLGSTYQHQITKGLGPQHDQINSLSIMTGARVTLKTKKKN